MSRCSHCLSFLDAPRLRPGSRTYGRKCQDCLRWQPLPARQQLAERLRRRAAI